MANLFLTPKLVPVSEQMPVDPQEIVDLVSEYTGIGGTDGFTGVNIGSSTPGVTSQDVPWFKTNVSDQALGWFYFQGGVWRPVIPIGTIYHFAQDFVSPPPGYALCNGTGTYFDEDLTEYDIPDHTDRVLTGVGNLYTAGDTGGVDSVAASLALPATTGTKQLANGEIPDHTHTYFQDIILEAEGLATSLSTPSTSNGQATNEADNQMKVYATERGGASPTAAGLGASFTMPLTGNATGNIDVRQKYIASPSIIYIGV